jgi:hemolysin activation/secretion protein
MENLNDQKMRLTTARNGRHQPSRLLLASLITVCATSPLDAQNLEKIQPEPVPQLVEPLAASAPMVDVQELRTDLIGANGDEQVILDELKQIIILEDPAQLNTIQLKAGQSSNLNDYPELDSEGLRGVLELYLGLPVSQESLQRLRYTLKLILSQEGRPFSLVYIPPQDITAGSVQIVVRQSLIGDVRIEGAQYFSESSYLSRLKLKTDDTIHPETVRTGIDRINQNSFRSAAVRVEKGAAPGTTDVVLQVREHRPYRAFAGYNNTGSLSTTEDRMFVGFTLGNVFGLAHQMTMQATSDFDIEHSKSVSGNYIMDLPYNHTATVFGAYSEIVSLPSGGFDQAGTSWQLGLNYKIPLREISHAYTHSMTLGIDYKSSDNNLELNLAPFIIPIYDNLTHVAQFRAQYQGTLEDRFGYTSFAAKLTYSPGNLGSKNDDDAFGQSRAFATSDYVYTNLELSRTTNFTGMLDGWTWLLRGELQLSDTNLLSSEQYSAGGSYSVRGYEESEVVGDNAYFLSQELQLPMLSTKVRLPGFERAGALRFFVFEDYAKTWNTDKLAGEKGFYLHSVGAGLRYQVANNLTVNMSHGWQLRDSGSSSTGDNYRTHVSLQFSY